MIQILLHGLKMDPLVSLHYYAPVCAVINLAILPFTEGLAPFQEVMRLGCVRSPFAPFLVHVTLTRLVCNVSQPADPPVQRHGGLPS